MKVIDLKSLYESQSFIHQVRILSRLCDEHNRNSRGWSQSFIHQVRILSQKSYGLEDEDIETGRNPLFIKSEFSHLYGETAKLEKIDVAILYSSSQNSLLPSSLSLATTRRGRNPLFIKSEFSLEKYVTLASNLAGVAILYSSSQNSLNKVTIDLKGLYGDVAVAILYSSSQNSLSMGNFLKRRRRWKKVAILYSSSQNSLPLGR